MSKNPDYRRKRMSGTCEQGREVDATPLILPLIHCPLRYICTAKSSTVQAQRAQFTRGCGTTSYGVAFVAVILIARSHLGHFLPHRVKRKTLEGAEWKVAEIVQNVVDNGKQKSDRERETAGETRHMVSSIEVNRERGESLTSNPTKSGREKKVRYKIVHLLLPPSL
jgi:hypothetical protein